MLNTLEKVHRLEQYLGFEEPPHDPIVDRTITKLLLRESARMEALHTRLSEQIVISNTNIISLPLSFIPGTNEEIWAMRWIL